MQISRSWCGFTGGQADTLRKAVGKKKIDLMKKVKPEFIEGAIKVGGATEEIAETFWNQLLDFANYCFNKSHAACYALIAYWTAYLKAHYPDAFMAALMTSDMDDTDRLAIEIAESKRIGIRVLGPDINESYGDFGIVPGEKTIRFGLAGIKNMGKSLIEDYVIPEREKNGPFESVCDFASRVDSTKFNKKSWESAIRTGVFDCFSKKDTTKNRWRSDLLFNLENIQGYGSKIQKDKASGQTDMFGAFGYSGSVPEPKLQPAPTEVTDKEMLLWERDLMGLYISAHPLDKYDTFFKEQTHPYELVTPENDGKTITVGGIISSVRTILTKKNDKMAFVKIENKTSEQEIIVFPNLYATVGGKLEQDNVVKITGTINAKDKDGNVTSDVKINAENLEVISDDILDNYHSTGEKLPPLAAAPAKKRRTRTSAERAYAPKKSAPAPEPSHAPATPPEDPRSKKLYILIKEPDNTELLTNIRHACDRNPGVQEIIMVLDDGKNKTPIRPQFKVTAGEELVSSLSDLLGKDCVIVK